MRTSLVSLALAFALAAPALAQTPASSLTFKDPRPGPASTIIDGAVWRCSPSGCTANGGDSQRPLRACRRVVTQLGQVSAFTWQGQALSAADVADCNTAARK
jgi:hypothetical protein